MNTNKKGILIPLTLVLALGFHNLVNVSSVETSAYYEGVHALSAYHMIKGERIYVDFSSHQPPILPYLTAVLLSVSGVSFTILRILAVACSMLSALILLMFALKESTRKYFVGLLVLTPFYYNSVRIQYNRLFLIEPFALYLLCAAVYLSLKKNPAASFSGGLLSSAALFTKLSAAPAMVTVFLVKLFSDRRNLPYVMVGVVIGCLPYSTYLFSSMNTIQQVFLFQLEKDPLSYENRINALLRDYHLLPLLSVISIPYLIKKEKNAVSLWLLTSLSFMFFVINDTQSMHTYVHAPVMFLAASIFSSEQRSRVVFLVLMLAFTYSVLKVKPFTEIQDMTSTKSASTAQAVSYITSRTSEDDKILSDSPLIAFLSKRMVYGDTVDTSVARIEADELTEDYLVGLLKEKKPKFVVIQEHFEDSKLSDFMTYVHGKYQLNVFGKIKVYEY